jgi:hypothetical protein
MPRFLCALCARGGRSQVGASVLARADAFTTICHSEPPAGAQCRGRVEEPAFLARTTDRVERTLLSANPSTPTTHVGTAALSEVEGAVRLSEPRQLLWSGRPRPRLFMDHCWVPLVSPPLRDVGELTMTEFVIRSEVGVRMPRFLRALCARGGHCRHTTSQLLRTVGEFEWHRRKKEDERPEGPSSPVREQN